MTTNRIITRGLGASRGASGRAGLITQGYGGIPPVIVQSLSRPFKHGKSGKRIIDEIELVTLWAKLIEVNGNEPKRPIKGSISINIKNINVTSIIAERISYGINRLVKAIKISIDRVK